MSLSPYRQAANRFLWDALPRTAGARGLDVGGAGWRSRATYARQTDQSWDVLDPAADPGSAYACRLEEATITSPYDILKVTDVLYLLDDPAVALRRLRGWVTPGGCLVATVPLCTELGLGHYWRGSGAAWGQMGYDSGWRRISATVLGGRWSVGCHLVDSLGVPGLRWAARRATPAALACDRRWPSYWVLGVGLVMRP